MNFLQFQYFMAVMEHKNFTKAADTVYNSQSNVSKQIAKLEAELGVVLFDRKSTGVCPTAAAEFLYAGLQAIVPDFMQLLVQTKKLQVEHQRELKIGLCDGIDFDRILFPVFAAIKQRASDLHLQVDTYSTEDIVNHVLEGRLDAGIVFSVMGNYEDVLGRRPLNRANSRIYYSKRHRLYGKKNLSVDDFRDETFFRLSDNLLKKSYHPYDCLPFIPRKIVALASLNAILVNIESCEGVGLFGESQVFLGKESLATLEINSEEHKVGTDIIWRLKGGSHALQYFLSLL